MGNQGSIHGVFLKVFDLGVLLVGPSGIGKSELALGLINRGHQLIADDSVDLFVDQTGWLLGKSPPLLQDFLEVRGLGILNIRAMYGDTAIEETCKLQFIVKMLHFTRKRLQTIDRLTGLRAQRQLLGTSVPEVTLPIIMGRNLAVLLEAAVRDQKLRLTGYNASLDMSQRQQQAIINPNGKPSD